MKSKASFSKTALRKDLSRFWPVWIGYILWLIIMQVMQSNNDMTYWYAANIAEGIAVMGVVNMAYGLVVAQMLFGDLFQTRMAYGLHALPLKREQWYSAHITAGFLFSLLPTVLVTVFSEIIIARYSAMVSGWQLPLYWFAASNLQYVFFFGLAVFCAMVAGSRLAMAAVYAILNFASLLVYLLVDQFYAPLLFGVTAMSTVFEILCPVQRLLTLKSIDCNRRETGNLYIDSFGVEQREYIGTFTVEAPGWIYTFMLAGLGILLLLVARQIYKKRQLERAGDFMAVRWLDPVFQVVFTVVCAAGFHAVCMLFFGIRRENSIGSFYILPAIGLTAGWFAGRMLLERSTRVFRLKNFVGFGLITAVMAGSLLLTHWDPLGIETWIPEPDEVEYATLRMNYRNGYTTEEAVEIQDFTRLHELALEQRVSVHPDYDDSYFNPYTRDPQAVQIILQYTGKNGLPVQRNYYVLAEGESGELVRKYTSRLDVLLPHLRVNDAEDLRNEFRDARYITVNNSQVPAEALTEDFLRDFADAVAADTEAGNMVQSGVFHPEPVIRKEGTMPEDLYYLVVDMQCEESWISFLVYADCENILAVLEPTGVLEAVRLDYANNLY